MLENKRPSKALEVWIPIEPLVAGMKKPFEPIGAEVTIRETYTDIPEGTDPLNFRIIFLSDYGKSLNHLVIRQGWPKGWKRSQVEAYIAGFAYPTLAKYIGAVKDDFYGKMMTTIALEALKEEKEEEE